MQLSGRRWGLAVRDGGLRIRVPGDDSKDGPDSPDSPDTPDTPGSPDSVGSPSSSSPTTTSFPAAVGAPPPATTSDTLPPPAAATTTSQPPALAPAVASGDTTTSSSAAVAEPSIITSQPPAAPPSTKPQAIPVVTSQPAGSSKNAGPTSTSAQSSTTGANAGIDSSSDRPGIGTQAGIAMGTIAGLAFLVSVLFCAYKWRKRRNRAGNENSDVPGDETSPPSRPWTSITGLSWPGRRKQSDSKIIDEMMRAAYAAESGGQGYPPGAMNENGYIDEKNSAALNGYYGQQAKDPGVLPPGGTASQYMPELATHDLRTPDPTLQQHPDQQQPRYSFLDRPPSEYWRARQSRVTVSTNQPDQQGDGTADLVSPETPRSTVGPAGWFRREQRRVENVGAAHSRLVGQFEPHGLDLTLHSGGARGQDEAEAERRARAISMAPTEMTASTETTWKTWAVEKKEVPKTKNWLGRYMEKGG